jgi:hypothetical protein
MWISVGLGKVLDNMKASATDNLCHYMLEQYKPWFQGECLKLLD